jgi:hypothetical protein
LQEDVGSKDDICVFAGRFTWQSCFILIAIDIQEEFVGKSSNRYHSGLRSIVVIHLRRGEAKTYVGVNRQPEQCERKSRALPPSSQLMRMLYVNDCLSLMMPPAV